MSKGGFKFFDWQIAQSRVYFVPLYKNKKIKVFQRVTISWGKPISVEELGIKNGDRQEYRYASNVVMDRIKEMRAEELNSRK